MKKINYDDECNSKYSNFLKWINEIIHDDHKNKISLIPNTISDFFLIFYACDKPIDEFIDDLAKSYGINKEYYIDEQIDKFTRYMKYFKHLYDIGC